jgi:hypothetical protein
MTPDEVRAEQARTWARWKKKVWELTKSGEFYTGDLFEALVADGEVFENRQRFSHAAYKMLRVMEATGELISEARIDPAAKHLMRRYYRRA